MWGAGLGSEKRRGGKRLVMGTFQDGQVGRIRVGDAEENIDSALLRSGEGELDMPVQKDHGEETGAETPRVGWEGGGGSWSNPEKSARKQQATRRRTRNEHAQALGGTGSWPPSVGRSVGKRLSVRREQCRIEMGAVVHQLKVSVPASRPSAAC